MTTTFHSDPLIMCDGTAPPTCCQPLTEADMRCPNCGSDLVMLTLLAPRELECWEPDCFAVWTVDR